MTRIFSWLTAILFAVLASAAPAAAQPDRPIRLVVLGDSLSSGFLIPTGTALPAVLEASLRQRGYPVTVANAGISGDRAAGGLARLDRDVPEGTDGVILELGANDKLKRSDPRAAEAALDKIVRRLAARRIPVLLVGIRFTDDTPEARAINPIFPAVARRHRLVYHPDIYAGLASDPRLTIFDDTHPSPAGVRHMVAGLLPAAESFIRTRIVRRRAAR